MLCRLQGATGCLFFYFASFFLSDATTLIHSWDYLATWRFMRRPFVFCPVPSLKCQPKQRRAVYIFIASLVPSRVPRVWV
ncbi:hypothetical protein F4678DRAFT_395727 [Xylaria arbuscula]|nr:hypothetical protein F4678DRAFT_395727 [Xylaria arbuscula]